MCSEQSLPGKVGVFSGVEAELEDAQVLANGKDPKMLSSLQKWKLSGKAKRGKENQALHAEHHGLHRSEHIHTYICAM